MSQKCRPIVKIVHPSQIFVQLLICKILNTLYNMHVVLIVFILTDVLVVFYSKLSTDIVISTYC